MGNKTKHTPGPWVIGSGYGRYKTEITGPGRAVGGVWTRRDAGALSDERRIEDDPEGIANARLIAAAPNMHEYIAKRAAAGDSEARVILESINASR